MDEKTKETQEKTMQKTENDTKIQFVPEKPLILNWVYRHIREAEKEFTLSDESKKAHITGTTEEGDKISIPACVICGMPLVPCFELPKGEIGIIESCPKLPALLQSYSQLNQMVSKTYPKNSPCPCGSGKQYKRCHGVSKDE